MVLPLGQLRNEVGWRFIGIDKDGGEHCCVVRKSDTNSYYMSSNTITFQDLIGWITETDTPSATRKT